MMQVDSVPHDCVGSKRRDASKRSEDLKKACGKSKGVNASYQEETRRSIIHPKFQKKVLEKRAKHSKEAQNGLLSASDIC